MPAEISDSIMEVVEKIEECLGRGELTEAELYYQQVLLPAVARLEGEERKMAERLTRGLRGEIDDILRNQNIPDVFRGNPHFKFVSEIGGGGMGVVYEAIDAATGRRLAIKTIKNPTRDALLRFKREFRALNAIQHPNLINYGELSEHNGVQYFTMDYIEGDQFVNYVRGWDKKAAETDKTEALAEGHADTVFAEKEVSTGSLPTLKFDPERLKQCVRQMAEVLMVVHDHKLVHRDVKPGNVIVTPGGRVVLLDFGIVKDHQMNGVDDSSDGSLKGTPKYIAPEIIKGGMANPEADYYAIGVMMYESMVDVPPFKSMGQAGLIVEKTEHDPVPPAEIDPNIPPALSELCMALMNRDPKKRPSGEEIHRILGCPVPDTSKYRLPEHSLPGTNGHTPLVGRNAHFAVLQDAYERVKTGLPVSLVVHGESGVGKSQLVEQYLQQIEEEYERGKKTTIQDARKQVGQLVLRGRCYERENVPYKGLDGIVESFTKSLSRWPDEVISELVPPDAEFLCVVFPVLGTLTPFANAPKRGLALEPQEMQQRVFEAVRVMFSRTSDILKRHGLPPLVLVIDDLQRADPDSHRMLKKLCATGKMPPMLLLSTLRGGEKELNDLPFEAEKMAIEKLDYYSAHELTELLLKKSGVAYTQETIDVIINESEGHPMFIHELILTMKRKKGETASKGIKMDEAIWERIETLSRESKSLLYHVVAAGQPIQIELLIKMSSLGSGEVFGTITALRNAKLVRTERMEGGNHKQESGRRKEDWVEPYHDRIREAVLNRMSPELSTEVHRNLALALETQKDHQALAMHWELAGDMEKAFQNAVKAARQAKESIAFQQQARFLETALALDPPSLQDEQRRQLHAEMAEALANLGQGKKSSDAYRTAAEGADEATRINLISKAADQLIRSGQISEGFDILLKEVYPAVGLKMPKSSKGMFLELLWTRARLNVRGLKFKKHEEAEVPKALLQQIDACWPAAAGFGMVEPFRGALESARALLLSLKAGEPTRILRALGVECIYSCIKGKSSEKYTLELMETMKEIAKEIDEPYANLWLKMVELGNHFMMGRFKEAYASYREAEKLASECNRDVFWEKNSLQLWGMWARYYMGMCKELQEDTPDLIQDSEQRGDLYIQSNAKLGVLNSVHLMVDDPGKAKQENDKAYEDWPTREGIPKRLQHYYHALGKAQIELYQGQGEAAFNTIGNEWGSLKTGFLTDIQIIRVEFWNCRARAAVMAGMEMLRAGGRDNEARRVLRVAKKDAQRILKQGMEWANPMANLILAGLARMEGQEEISLQKLQLAADGFRQANMTGFEAAARWQLAGSQGAGDKDEHQKAAIAWTEDEKIKNPAAWFNMLAPGFADHEPEENLMAA